MSQSQGPRALWSPSPEWIQQTHMEAFKNFVSAQTGLRFANYSELHAWSIDEISQFWGLAASFLKIAWDQAPERPLDPPQHGKMLGGQWFPGGRLSWTKNLLGDVNDPQIKIISIIEGHGEPVLYSGAELSSAVARLSSQLKKRGVSSGDRVAAVLPNTAEAVIGMLATAALGAIWTSCSPDFGATGIVDRFGQIAPKVLIATRSYMYNGKIFDCRPTAAAVLQNLASVELAVMIDILEQGSIPEPWRPWTEMLRAATAEEERAFEPLATAFDHPLYILYSSGTTGKPKCLVHSVGGTLLQHKKELMLHSNLGPGKRLLYYTTCGWMMWNWMVSALSVGASLVLFEGSVTREDSGILWRTLADYGINCLGSSPKFLAACQKAGLVPRQTFNLDALETILSTGSPLMPEQFQWVYQAVKQNVHLASICGGTDIVSCFMLGNPISPVWSGEIQGPGLGMAVACWDEAGHPLLGKQGELVCTKAFPAMPLGFWQDDAGKKYRETYFSFYPEQEVWRHGDYIEITARGGIIVYGRSDATLNPGGVRIGTAEIYRQVESFPEIQDSLAISRQRDGDAEILLFLKLKAGLLLEEELVQKVRRQLRQELSPRHVPAVIYQVADIPYTRSGKKLELAVTRIFQGQALDNLSAIANPESLEAYRKLAHKA